MNVGNGTLVCGSCLGALEYSAVRQRKLTYTSENGPTSEAIDLTVGHCPQEGRYKSIYPKNVLPHKHYALSDIQSALENKADYSLASARTKAYWRAWFREIWKAVVHKIHLLVDPFLDENGISTALQEFCKTCKEGWLRYVLDLYYTENNNLCMFFDIVCATVALGCKILPKSSLSSLKGPRARGRDSPKGE